MEKEDNKEILPEDQEEIVDTIDQEPVQNDWEDQYLRLAAEFDNYRKRSQKEKLQIYGDAVAEVLQSWIPLVDNLDRAFSNATVQDKEGIEKMRKQAYAILDKLGVEEIDALGNTFDPNLHHAILHEDNEDYGTQEIIEVLEKGYKIQDRVIRYSIVKVAN